MTFPVEVIVAMIGAFQVIVVALVGVLVAKVGKVNHELKPNSGKSMRDGIDRIEARQKVAERKLDRDNLRIESLDRRVTEHIEQSSTIVRLLAQRKKES